MLKISDAHVKQFEHLNDVEAALKAKMASFMDALAAEHLRLVQVGNVLWNEVMAKYGLEGRWRYEDGKLWPTNPPDMAQAVPPDLRGSVHGNPNAPENATTDQRAFELYKPDIATPSGANPPQDDASGGP